MTTVPRSPSVPQAFPGNGVDPRSPVPLPIRERGTGNGLEGVATDRRFPHLTFGAWLNLQTGRGDAVGDLADALAADPVGPSNPHPCAVLDYLSVIGTPATQAACRAAVREWGRTC